MPLSPPLADLALKFDAAEYFSLMVLGLISAVALAHGSVLKAILMTLLGLLLGMVGTEVNAGMARFSFNRPELIDGIGFVAMTMGLFAFGGAKGIRTSNSSRSRTGSCAPGVTILYLRVISRKDESSSRNFTLKRRPDFLRSFSRASSAFFIAGVRLVRWMV